MIGKKINQLATELAPVSTDLTIIGDPDSGVSKKITLAQLGAIFSGAVSFYTNLASFPAVGDINVIYCAKDTQKLYLWSGSAYVEVFPSQALLDTYQLRSEKGNANGYASLDSQGKVPISQLPSSIMEYKGTWNAATNTPTLANGTGDTGDVYICNVAGTVNFGAGPITFAVGDYVIYSGTIWQRSSGAVGTVTSVAASITGDSVTISGSPVTTSGTLAFAFAGTGAQYIKGDGTLATFPNTIDQAKNLITEVYNSTGATLTKGTVVYINGGQGNLPTVTKALASGDSTSAQTYGIVQNDITNNNNGFVVVAGRLSDIDTQAFSVGTQLYLSSTTAGAYTSTKQYAPAHLVYVGIIVRSHPTQGIIEVKIQNGYEMDELHNVAAQTPTNNDGLFWEASTSLWKNKSLSTILGGTPVTGSGNVNAIPKFTANSVLGNSVMEDDGNFVSMRGLKINAVAGVGNTINFQQGSGITAAGLGYSTIGAASTTGFVFYIDQNTTSRSFILDTSTITSATQLTYSLPASSGTLALVSQLTGGTVTSVGLSVPTGFAVSGSPVTSSGTLALAFDTGYSLPTIVKQNNWDTAYNTRIVTASSPLSFISNTISISQASGSANGFLSSTDWTTFNNKQNALTNPVTGTGTTNYLPKFTGTSTIGNSLVYDNGTNVGIGTASPDAILHIAKSNSGGIGGQLVIDNPVADALNNAVEISFLTAAGASGTGIRNARIQAVEQNASTGATNIQFWTYNGANDAERMRLDASGNLGLGVTPSAWVVYRAFQLGTGIAVGGLIGRTDGVNEINFGLNWTYTGGASLTYIASSFATNYYQKEGAHIWQTAPSGTAGNAISFTQAMTLTSAGELCVGRTSAYGAGFLVNVQGNIYASASIVAGSSVTAGGSVTATSSANSGLIAATNSTSGYAYLDLINNAASGKNYQIGVGGNSAASGYANNLYFDLVGVGSIMTLTSSRNVGIGTTSPTNKLEVVGNVRISIGSGFDSYFGYGGNLDNYYSSGDSGTHIWRTGNTERMRITSGGNVGIATTAPKGKLGIGDQTKMVETTGITLGTGDGVIEFIGSQFGLGYGMKIWQSGERTLSIAGRAGSGVFTNYFTVFDTGKINMSNLPTSSAGLSSGDIYNDSGTLKIV